VHYTDKQITVVFVIGNLDIGGAERHLIRLLPLLQQAGLGVSVCTLTQKGSMASTLEKKDIDVFEPPFITFLQKIPHLIRNIILVPVATINLWLVLMRKRPLVVHTFLPAAYLMGGFCRVLAGIPYLVMSRRSLNQYQRNHPVLMKLELLLHKTVDVALGNSRAVIGQLLEEDIPGKKLGLIYNGVDESWFTTSNQRDALRNELGLHVDTLVIIVVANLIVYKGHRELFQALARYKDEMPDDWRLICIGKDKGIGYSLNELATSLGIKSHVYMSGEKQDIRSYLVAADISVLCSHQEGFSNTIIESMAAGLPMVVTNVGGNAEAVEDKVTGFVVEAMDIDGIGLAVNKLAIDKELRSKMGKAGKDRAMNLFSMNTCTARYIALYNALANGVREPIEEVLERVTV